MRDEGKPELWKPWSPKSYIGHDVLTIVGKIITHAQSLICVFRENQPMFPSVFISNMLILLAKTIK